MSQLDLLASAAAVVATIVLQRKLSRPLGPIVALTGAWLLVIGISLVIQAGNATAGGTMSHYLWLLLAGLVLCALGAYLALVGVLVLTDGIAMAGQEAKHRHSRRRSHADMEIADVQGGLRLVVAPDRPWRNGRPRLELVRYRSGPGSPESR